LVKAIDKDEEMQEQEKTRKKGSFTGNFILLLVAVILIILFLFGGAFFVAWRTGFIANIMGGANPAQTTQQVVVKEPAFTYEIPEIVVNLTDGERRRFLSVKFYVGYDESKLTEEIKRRMPEIRDTILQTLWGVTAEEASSTEGKERIRDEILQAVNALLNEGNIIGIYFWHVMIQ